MEPRFTPVPGSSEVPLLRFPRLSSRTDRLSIEESSPRSYAREEWNFDFCETSIRLIKTVPYLERKRKPLESRGARPSGVVQQISMTRKATTVRASAPISFGLDLGDRKP